SDTHSKEPRRTPDNEAPPPRKRDSGRCVRPSPNPRGARYISLAHPEWRISLENRGEEFLWIGRDAWSGPRIYSAKWVPAWFGIKESWRRSINPGADRMSCSSGGGWMQGRGCCRY